MTAVALPGAASASAAAADVGRVGSQAEARPTFATFALVREPLAQGSDIVCPHCKKRFQGELLGGSGHRGFKCPHCRLFVPIERADTDGSAAPAD